MEKLKACPFCGSKKIMTISLFSYWPRVYCPACKAKVIFSEHKHMEQAVRRWNTRAEQ